MQIDGFPQFATLIERHYYQEILAMKTIKRAITVLLWIVSVSASASPTNPLTIVLRASTSTSSVNPADCFFNWVEVAYPMLFPPPSPTSIAFGPYYLRYYSSTTSFLAAYSSENKLLYLGPLSSNTLLDIGALSDWYTTAGCAPAIPDTTAPSIPVGLVASSASISQVNLTWAASTDNVGVTSYKIYRNGSTLIATLGNVTSYKDTGLASSTVYSYTVAACDAAGNCSTPSGAALATTLVPPDTTAPNVPVGIAATTVSSSQISLSWLAATDNVGVTSYKVYRGGGTLIATLANVTSYSDTGLRSSTAYSYTVAACDAAANCSTQSSAASATTLTPPDTIAPSAPVGLLATSVSSSQVSLTWSAATDNVGVTSYKVYRNGGTLIATLGNVTTYSDTGLTSSTSYSYRVAACDAAANCSSQSSAALATTQASILQAPTLRQSFSGSTAQVLSAITMPKGYYKISVTTSGYFELFDVSGLTVFNLSSGEANGAETIFYSPGRDVTFRTDNVRTAWTLVIESIDFSNPQPITNINSFGTYPTPRILGPYTVTAGSNYVFSMLTNGYFQLFSVNPYTANSESTIFNQFSGNYGAETIASFPVGVILLRTDNISGTWAITVRNL